MKSKKLLFENEQGLMLSGRIDFPVDQRTKAYALFAHCFTCSSSLQAVRNIRTALNQKGIAIMQFDFTGLGRSEGAFAETNFSGNVADLVRAAQAMEKEYEAPQLLIGHSLGGAAVLMAAHEIASVKAVATIGAPAAPNHVTHLFQSQEEQIKAKGTAEVNIGGRPFQIKKQFLDDLELYDEEGRTNELKKALLIMHSPQDNIVGIKEAEKIYLAARHPKSFVTLDQADHLLTNKNDAFYAGQVIASWSERYIDLPEENILTTDAQVAVRTGPQGYTTDILAGNHSLLADEPLSVGGDDLGPSPYGYLNAALGACTSMTLRMYADRKKWPLESVTVHVSHGKDYAKDCEDCEDNKSKIDVFDRTIELEGDLDTSQRKRLMEIADRCPVHRTLHNDIEVRTKLIEP